MMVRSLVLPSDPKRVFEMSLTLAFFPSLILPPTCAFPPPPASVHAHPLPTPSPAMSAPNNNANTAAPAQQPQFSPLHHPGQEAVVQPPSAPLSANGGESNATSLRYLVACRPLQVSPLGTVSPSA
jgi:hypothetical protein